MQKIHFAGVELYFEDLPCARAFYKDVLGLEIADETPATMPNLMATPVSFV